MKRIGISCKDDYLFQKIKLILSDTAFCERVAKSEISGFDAVLATDEDEKVLRLVGGTAVINIPFLYEDVTELLRENKESAPLVLEKESRVAVLRGRRIKMTELEYKLIELLLSDTARVFSKEEILNTLWEPGTDAGIVNVYIHYLREKLETDGERVIASARGVGYKIDPRFIERSVQND